MPNWVSNIVKCDNSDALHQLRDFSLIIPEHPTIALFNDWASQRTAQLFKQGKSWRQVAADAEFVAHLAREQKDIRKTPSHPCARCAPLLVVLQGARLCGLVRLALRALGQQVERVPLPPPGQ